MQSLSKCFQKSLFLFQKFSRCFAITHMPVILKTDLLSLLLTILEAHQETEQEEMLLCPFVLIWSKNIQCCEIFSGREGPRKSDETISSKASISSLLSISCILLLSHSLDSLGFFQKNIATNSGHLKQTNRFKWHMESEHSVGTHLNAQDAQVAFVGKKFPGDGQSNDHAEVIFAAIYSAKLSWRLVIAQIVVQVFNKNCVVGKHYFVGGGK